MSYEKCFEILTNFHGAKTHKSGKRATMDTKTRKMQQLTGFIVTGFR